MKIYEVWHYKYKGGEDTHSFWFYREAAEQTAERLNSKTPLGWQGWQVIEQEMSDLPE